MSILADLCQRVPVLLFGAAITVSLLCQGQCRCCVKDSVGAVSTPDATTILCQCLWEGVAPIQDRSSVCHRATVSNSYEELNSVSKIVPPCHLCQLSVYQHQRCQNLSVGVGVVSNTCLFLTVQRQLPVCYCQCSVKLSLAGVGAVPQSGMLVTCLSV